METAPGKIEMKEDVEDKFNLSCSFVNVINQHRVTHTWSVTNSTILKAVFLNNIHSIYMIDDLSRC